MSHIIVAWRFFKITVYVFNIIPWIALHIVI